MHCYRRLDRIEALSFDLDDTLYENGPILMRAEEAQLTHLYKYVPEVHKTDQAFWLNNQRQFTKANADMIHDMAKLRLHAIYHGLLSLGLPDKDAHLNAQTAFEAFHQERTKVDIDSQVRDLLVKLKKRYRLVALTNGTAEIDKMGLGDVFEFVIHAGENRLKQKPSKDMYHAATERLGIRPRNMLHIGDSLSHDIKGALRAGCSALWANYHGKKISTRSALPHLEINHIQQLEALL